MVGKLLGIVGGTVLAVRLGLARLPAGLSWGDLAMVGLLAGCGFTVSLLVNELAYTQATMQSEVGVGVLAGSVLAAAAAAAFAPAHSREPCALTAAVGLQVLRLGRVHPVYAGQRPVGDDGNGEGRRTCNRAPR